MKKWFLYVMPTILMGCHSPVKNSKSAIMSCVLLGYDSMAYYYGDSKDMNGLTSGLLNDSAFITHFISVVKTRQSLPGFKIAIKPTASGNVGTDFKVLVDLLNVNEFEKRSIDSLDENEQKRFNATSLTAVMKHSQTTFMLPAEDGSGKNVSSSSDAPAFTILIFKDTGLYVYRGTDIKDGKIYRYTELKKLISTEKSTGSVSVLIKPSSNNTYKNTVNILDEMTNINITDYKLVDISPEEEAFLGKLSE